MNETYEINVNESTLHMNDLQEIFAFLIQNNLQDQEVEILCINNGEVQHGWLFNHTCSFDSLRKMKNEIHGVHRR